MEIFIRSVYRTVMRYIETQIDLNECEPKVYPLNNAMHLLAIPYYVRIYSFNS